MILRYIYKIWKYFWRTVFTLAGIFLVTVAIIVGMLQMPVSKNYMKDEVMSTFNSQFEGTLTVGEVEGFLPFSAIVRNGKLYAPSDSTKPVFTFQKAEVKMNWWELLQRKLSVSSFEVSQPIILISKSNNDITLLSALRQREKQERTENVTKGGIQIFQEINIYAPSISVHEGKILVDDSIELPSQIKLPTPFEIENVDFNTFLEVTKSQIYFDLPDFTANLPDTPYQYIQASGQFYNDKEFFELNRFKVSTALGEADFSFEASPVTLFESKFNQQFQDATYRFQITESSFNSLLIQQFTDNYPPFVDELEIELQSEGTLDEYFIDKLSANIGGSSVLITASGKNLFSDDFSYDAHLDNVVIQPELFDWVSETYFDNKYNLQRYQLSTIQGELNGNLNELKTNFQAQTHAGSFYLDGDLVLNKPLGYNLSFEVDSLDITPFLSDTTRSSVIQGEITLNGEGVGGDAHFRSSVDLSTSVLLGVDLESFVADFEYEAPRLDYDIHGGDGEFFVSAKGLYEKNGEQHRFVSDGKLQNLDINKFYPDFYADYTSFNSTFSANLEGSSIDDLYGRVSFEMGESIINEDTLRAHQFYADLIPAEGNSRALRFTSSFFDGELRGTLDYNLIRKYALYWSVYLKERIAQEFLFIPDYFGELQSPDFNESENPTLDLTVDMTVKDLSLFRKYIPEFPEIESNAKFNASFNASKDRLIITGNLFDQAFRANQIHANDFNTTFTASFRHQSDLKTSNTVDLHISSSESGFGDYNFKDGFINITMRNDSIQVQQRFERQEDNLVLESTFSGRLQPEMLRVTLDDFTIGTSDYKWTAQGNPSLTYTAQQSVKVDSLILVSDTDYLAVDGTFSDDFDDSVNYTVRNLDLSRVSELLDGRVSFSGTLNGDFETRTLTQIPSIQGNLNIEESRIMGRLIGDVSLNSKFNSETERFDTEINIFTDPQKYSRYYNRNNGIGQNIQLSGYFKLPDDSTPPDEELFNFDADLRQIDMWVVSVIVPNIIVDMEGSASGKGYIKGTANDFDFDATFNIKDVYAVPAFTNVEYTMNGTIRYNKSDGVIFDNVKLADNWGGTGRLNGQVDIQKYRPTTTDLDLTFDLDHIQFMNNQYDPDIPFYGKIYGTGQARITGTNFAPVLRTTRPLLVTSNSKVSVPLEPETEFEQDHRFIQFVDTFDQPIWQQRLSAASGPNGVATEAPPEELSFMERFTMDLQFQANNPINVELIFDRVTNDMINANGTGQIRILLEDQDVSMFGRFNITSGSYQFVSGDIFTRRFTLEDGGSISWSGDLEDADLDVTAVYRARPNINTLLATSGDTGTRDPGQRIPIELVLEIGGTMTSVENNFFFRVPTGIEGNVDPTIATQISNLNQNEDEKLVQATSILLSGNFLPPSQAQGLGITESFSGTAVVVNPLITSQLINPLLSNQINSLLKSDITFDIDFNLNAFNEVDLGVALRLFDDRIVLRREGQITGEQSTIGDIGATYRINRTLSVTAFHRQDPTLTNTSSSDLGAQQTQETNGVGLEAQVQFNTWKRLKKRISNAFRSLFGLKKDNEEQKDESLADKQNS